MSNITDKNFKSNNSEFMRNEQIEEMAKVIFEVSPIPSVWWSDATRFAEALYNAGYRKQSEGEWEYDEDCECYVCSVCEHSALNNYRLLSTPSIFCPNCGARMKGESND